MGEPGHVGTGADFRAEGSTGPAGETEQFLEAPRERGAHAKLVAERVLCK